MTQPGGELPPRSGTTGVPAEQLAEQRHQRRHLTLEDATLLARAAAMAYREVLGGRRQREQAADNAEPGRRSTYL